MEQLENYGRDGFLVIENFVDRKTCEDLRTRGKKLVAEFDPQENISVFSSSHQDRTTDDYFLGSSNSVRFFFEEGAFDESGKLVRDKELSINKIGHALHTLDPVFSEFSTQASIQSVVRDLGVAAPVFLQSMLIFKQPQIGGEVGWHQDATFLHTEPVSVFGLWFALEDARRENGCMQTIRGGHRAGLKSLWIRNPDDSMRTEVFDDSPWETEKAECLEVPAGTLVVLHGLLPHMSTLNCSDFTRNAYTLHVVDGGARYLDTNWIRV